MPANQRRQTLAGGGSRSRPPMPLSNGGTSMPPSAGGSSGGSVASGSTSGGSRRRVPRGRKSMIPRCAGGGGGGGAAATSSDNNGSAANRENNGRRVSGISAPSPSRGNKQGASGSQQRPRPLPASRKSLGGPILQHGSHSHSSATPSKNRRVSLAPSASHHHHHHHSNNSSSSAATGGAAAPGASSNVDPRDVKDRSYLQSAVRKMVAYLKSRGYAGAANLNVRQLVTNGPSGRDFENFMTFLIRRMDPTFHQTGVGGDSRRQSNVRTDEVVLKFEDEVTIAFRTIGYPFPISKTGLVAVGSPHTWPALIAAIDWLVDVLTICDGEETLEWGPDPSTDWSDDDLLTPDGSRDRVVAQYHSFLRRSMVAFLDDDNERCEDLEGRLLDEFQRDSERVESYLTEMDAESSRMRDEIDALESEVSGLSEARAKQEEYAANIEKFLNLIQTLNDHKAELVAKVETLEAEKAGTEDETSACAERIGRLKETIGGQELSMEDVRRMEREKSRVEDQVSKHASVLDAKVATLKEAREKWDAVYGILERGAVEYNALAGRLDLAAVTLKRDGAADGVAELMGGVDVRGEVVPRVRELARDYESKTSKEKEQLRGVRERIEIAEGSCERVVEDIETIEDKIKACQEEGEAAREKLESEINAKRRRHDLLATKIASLDDPGGVESTIARYEGECEELERRRRRQEEDIVASKRAVADEIRDALAMAREYEERKGEVLADVDSYLERKRGEAEQVKPLDS